MQGMLIVSLPTAISVMRGHSSSAYHAIIPRSVDDAS